MRILWLNWRDIKNPASGGAEVVTHEVAKRWVQQGHSVTLFTAMFPRGATEEIVDGVRILRHGRQFAVHYHAWQFYRRSQHGQVDIVIDEINTLPFFTPFYVKEKRVAFFHQLAREVWLHELRFPINVLGYCLEPLYLRFYRSTPTVVVSESTARDLRNLGFRHVSIVHDGVDVEPLESVPSDVDKAPHPTIVSIGRLVPSKQVTHLVQAMHTVCQRLPDAQLWLVGDGPRGYVSRLHDEVARNQLQGHVRFWGKVSHEQKLSLLKQAHLLAMTSVREGWGLVVIEANALGTPAVVYDVPGLRDSVCHGETGVVCRPNTPQSLADNLVTLFTDRERRLNLARRALERSRTFTWDKNAAEFLRVLENVHCSLPIQGVEHP